MKMIGQALLNIISAPAVLLFEGLSYVIDKAIDFTEKQLKKTAVKKAFCYLLESIGCGLIVFGIFSEFEMSIDALVVKAAYIIVGGAVLKLAINLMPKHKKEVQQVLINDVIEKKHLQQITNSESWNSAYKIAVECNKKK